MISSYFITYVSINTLTVDNYYVLFFLVGFEVRILRQVRRKEDLFSQKYFHLTLVNVSASGKMFEVKTENVSFMPRLTLF